MNAPQQNERTLSALRIDVEPDFGRGHRTTIAMEEELQVDLHQGDFENLCDVLGRVAAGTVPPEGGLAYGAADGDRVVFAFDGADNGLIRFLCTFAYSTGGEPYRVVTGRALVAPEALARLAEAVGQVRDAGYGVVDWQVAG